MSGLFELSMPWWQFVLRAVVVYVVLLAMVRLSGKRTVGQFTPFDLIVIVLLGNAVQNSLIGEDMSLLGGLLLAGTLILLNWCTGWITSRSRRIDRLVEGSPVLLARDGEVFDDMLRRQQVSRADLEQAMRQADCAEIAEVGLAVLETNGHISVVRRRRD
ncbi:uncharacterized protein DUF421 [Luteimonas cucumeris]|uniref:Uncharacterized protein DUF421 n=1 Tax=Luteimonas cucumeris TaxID=985012 RepID=A0A562KX42_9GAMM|nr:YetF domain-containing protein [Luteimonas cucumeris]TWH99999.1 uncharacterized protein DUF421 [Luteimonas cucumeris]